MRGASGRGASGRGRPTRGPVIFAGLARPVRLLRRWGPRGVVLAGWAVVACRLVRRQVARGGLAAVRIPAPPAGPAGRHGARSVGDGDGAGAGAGDGAGGGRLVRLALARAGANCLERALVLQRWHGSRGDRRTVVIGVTAPRAGFHAHAWLDDESDAEREGMVELLRRPPPDGWVARHRQPDICRNTDT
ncbi:lasso peptide biosynthesis protein [Micromonospora sp. WMMD882]|uniref:lasso peptide biosynthesis protein n=1 Tax=Micromonospora sp. WMMD882 TaxID=3015151 RepID=UPI00248C944E|nr:lasso peptide biosynthesis protein [Micromonospora sp. WMMD882]WBB82084.1 lasso peptide biosynthesis protein [Micromonospora sp. WMMD882]